MDERGQDFYQMVSEMFGTGGIFSPPSFYVQTPDRVVAIKNPVNTVLESSSTQDALAATVGLDMLHPNSVVPRNRV